MSKPIKLQAAHRNTLLLGLALLIIFAATEAGLKYLKSKPTKTETDTTPIIEKASKSYQNWQELTGEAEIVWTRFGETQSYLVRFDFDLPEAARVITEDLNGGNNGSEWAFLRDGKVSFTDGNQNVSQEAIPPSLKQYLDDGQVFEAENAEYVHPFTLAIPSPVGEYLFPSWMSQKLNPENTRLIGEGRLSNRKVWILDAKLEEGESYKLWVDQETGVLLRVFHQMDADSSMELLIQNIMQFDGYEISF
jgi:outer membrane lipoprotein-sorting protein